MDSKKRLEDYRIIDIHNHIFPDKIAARAAESIKTFYSFTYMEGNGSSGNLLTLKKNLNIVKFVVCSAATKFDKVETANDFIIKCVFSDPIYAGFGTTHAGYTDHRKELERVKNAGLIGLKIHPDIQGFDIDDPGMYGAYEAASELGLPILFHIGDKKHHFSEARKLRRMMDKFPDLKVIAAHMGGYSKKNDAYEYLVGTNAYFDVSQWYNFLTEEEFVKMIYDHGVDKILYGCDFPLNSPYSAAEKFYNVNISDADKEKIFSTNSEKLFGIHF
ncbi:MAG: amidohydrolase [Ruminococcaceae bacterium]|nr:amidohydrolase [Oscillospiraceae bacterium]